MLVSYRSQKSQKETAPQATVEGVLNYLSENTLYILKKWRQKNCRWCASVYQCVWCLSMQSHRACKCACKLPCPWPWYADASRDTIYSRLKSLMDWRFHIQIMQMSALLLVLALSLHSIFEGLALGLQTSDSDVWQVHSSSLIFRILQDTRKSGYFQLFYALIIHESLVGFSLGIRLVQSKLDIWSVLICAVTFSLMSPLGNNPIIINIKNLLDENIAIIFWWYW